MANNQVPEGASVRGAPERILRIPERFKPVEVPTTKPKKEAKPAPPPPPPPSPKAPPPAAGAPPVEKSPTRKEIESILQEGLGNLYQGMTPEEQRVFSIKANETAGKLETLISTLKATGKEIVRIIRDLLSLIPKVNRYFLEQASKIKTDELMKLQAKKKKESRMIR